MRLNTHGGSHKEMLFVSNSVTTCENSLYILYHVDGSRNHMYCETSTFYSHNFPVLNSSNFQYFYKRKHGFHLLFVDC